MHHIKYKTSYPSNIMYDIQHNTTHQKSYFIIAYNESYQPIQSLIISSNIQYHISPVLNQKILHMRNAIDYNVAIVYRL
jgi:hypothetical protein